MNERLDKYLWCVRLFKTRSDAAEAIRDNRVKVNDAGAKPSREVRVGDRVTIRRGPVNYSYKVLQLLSSRVGAPLVGDYLQDVTPAEELAKLDVPRETIFMFREKGSGRPTKKDRRDIEKIFE